MNTRIKKLRKALDLTQQDFADRLGTTRNNIAGYETGRRAPSVAVISLICREFNVSEAWLRTGEGEMFVQRSRNDELSSFVDQLLQSEPDDIRRRFVAAISRLSTQELELLEKTALHLAGELSSSSSPAPEAPALDIEAEVAAYRAELLSQQESQQEGLAGPTASTGSSANGKRLA